MEYKFPETRSLQLLLFEARDGTQEYLSQAQTPWGLMEQKDR